MKEYKKTYTVKINYDYFYRIEVKRFYKFWKKKWTKTQWITSAGGVIFQSADRDKIFKERDILEELYEYSKIIKIDNWVDA